MPPPSFPVPDDLPPSTPPSASDPVRSGASCPHRHHLRSLLPRIWRDQSPRHLFHVAPPSPSLSLSLSWPKLPFTPGKHSLPVGVTSSCGDVPWPTPHPWRALLVARQQSTGEVARGPLCTGPPRVGTWTGRRMAGGGARAPARAARLLTRQRVSSFPYWFRVQCDSGRAEVRFGSAARVDVQCVTCAKKKKDIIIFLKVLFYCRNHKYKCLCVMRAMVSCVLCSMQVLLETFTALSLAVFTL